MNKVNIQEGQALVALLFFVVMATIYASAAAIIISINSLSGSSLQRGVIASRFAEGIVEDTLMRLIRDPDYSGGSFNLSDGDVTVTVTGVGVKTILVEVRRNDFLRKFEAGVDLANNSLEVVSWKEVF